MYRKIAILVFGILFLLFTASAQAAVPMSFSFDVEYGNPANGGSPSGYPTGWPYAQFNITFLDPHMFQGVHETFGYCSEFDQSIYIGKSYNFTSAQVSTTEEYKAAWLMEKYAFLSADGSTITGTSDRNTITALQASIWSLLGSPNPWAPINPDTTDAAIYNLYQQMIRETLDLGTADLNGLDLKYQILMPYYQLPDGPTANFQNLIVRTNNVPIPGAAMLLAPVLLGLVGIRRKLAA